jgi:hypothetical protein
MGIFVMMALLILLLHLLAPCSLPSQEAPSDGGGFRLPEVVLFARDTYFLPVPKPPLPERFPLPWPEGRLAAVALRDVSRFPGDLAAVPAVLPPGLMAGAAPAAVAAAVSPSAASGPSGFDPGSGPGTAGGEAAAARPPEAGSAEAGGTRPEAAARAGEWRTGWEAGWRPGDSLQTEAAALYAGGGAGFSLGFRTLLPDTWLDADAGPPGSVLFRVQVRPGEGGRGGREPALAPELELAGGLAAYPGRETRYLAAGGAALEAEGAFLRFTSDTRYLGLYRSVPVGAAVDREPLHLAEEDLGLAFAFRLPWGVFQPSIRLQAAFGTGGGGEGFAGLLGLEGKAALDRPALTAAAGVALLVGTGPPPRFGRLAGFPSAGSIGASLYPQAGLEIFPAEGLTLFARASACLATLRRWETALLETMPQVVSPGPESGYRIGAGLRWETQPAQRLEAGLELLQGGAFSGSAGLVAAEKVEAIGLQLGWSSRFAAHTRASVFYRLDRPLSQSLPLFAGLLHHSALVELRAGFINPPLEGILQLEWAGYPANESEAIQFQSMREVPGGRVSLQAVWRLKNRNRLTAEVELLTGADLTPDGFRLGLFWGSLRAEE